MMIETSSFGAITVAGIVYTKDLLLFPDRVVPGWWRREGHVLVIEDLEEVLAFNPEIVVVGTGVFGALKVSGEVFSALEGREIQVDVSRTGKAVGRFNELIDKGCRVAGAFHLTC